MFQLGRLKRILRYECIKLSLEQKYDRDCTSIKLEPVTDYEQKANPLFF